MAEAARNIYPAQYTNAQANTNQAHYAQDSNVTLLAKKRQGGKLGRATRNPSSPYAAADQSTIVPVDDVEFLLQRYGMDYRPTHKQDANANSSPKPAFDIPSTQSKRNFAYAPPRTPPANLPQRPQRYKVTENKKEGRGVAFIALDILYAITALSFIATLATLQIMTSVLTILVFGLVGWIESFTILTAVLSWLGGLTGLDFAGLFFIFLFLSIAFGWAILGGLLIISLFRGRTPFSGKGTQQTILYTMALFVVAAIPFINIITVVVAIAWVVQMLRAGYK